MLSEQVKVSWRASLQLTTEGVKGGTMVAAAWSMGSQEKSKNRDFAPIQHCTPLRCFNKNVFTEHINPGLRRRERGENIYH